MPLPSLSSYQAVVVGVSEGALNALKTLLEPLPKTFPLPIMIVCHLSPGSRSLLAELLNKDCALKVREAEETIMPQPGEVWLAPPNYHLMIEADGSLSLSVDERCSYARPSIDVLFETAAWAHGENLIGIILTGANRDGSRGLGEVKKQGGLCIVQEPQTAQMPTMPEAAIKTVAVDHVLPLAEISNFLLHISE